MKNENDIIVYYHSEPPLYRDYGENGLYIFHHTEKTSEVRNLKVGSTIKKAVFDKWIAYGTLCDDNFAVIDIKKDIKSLKSAHHIAKYRINGYSNSKFVKSFTINGDEAWIDNKERAILKTRFLAEWSSGKKETTIWLNGKEYFLSLDGNNNAIEMITKLESYSAKCFDTTMKHYANIMKLDSYDELMKYDYTAGYPEKLSF